MRASIVASALLYFVISKVSFEPRLAIGPLSLNLLLQIAVIAGLAALPVCGDISRVIRSRTLWLVGALALLLALRAIGAQNSAYAPAKPLGYLGLVLPSFVIFVASLRSAANVRQFMILWALIGTGMLTLALILLLTGDAPPRLAVFGGGSNGFARIICTSFLVWLGLDTRLGSSQFRVWWLILPGLGIAILFAGSKAAILGLGFSLIILGLVNVNRRLVIGAAIATALFALAPFWTHEIAQQANKNRGEVRMFTEPDTADPRGSYGTRITYYRRSIEYLKEPRLLGVGTGEWHSVVGLPSGRRHPHNMELELACELGIPGLAWLLVMLAVLVRWVRTLRRSRADRRSVAALVAVLAFWLFNAQFNGDLLDNRWLLLAILLVEILLREQQTSRAKTPTLIAP